ncbi:MAG: hypothetical protein KF723_11855 [Rhizobiaceae bacterium]|nr:hypothetical protein [Rhizobiaceae bacterium]
MALAALPAAAQDMIKGVYARSPEQCTAAKADFQSFIENGEIVLTARGLEGIEFNCEFLDWKMATRSPGAVVTALCEEPGYAYPQVFAVMPRGEGELELTLAVAEADGEATNAGLYYLCDGVTMP